MLLVAAPQIQGATKLAAIYTEQSPPANFLREGELTGLAVDLVREVQARLGDQTPIELLPWARAYRYATTRPNIMIFSITRTPERENLFHWVGPLMEIEWTFYGKRERVFDITSLDDARHAGTIGTYFEDARERYLLEQGFENLESARNNHLNALKLMAGRIDLLVSSNMGIELIMHKAGHTLDEVQAVYAFRTMELHMGFSRETDPDIVRAWREQFEAVQADGTYDEIYARWIKTPSHSSSNSHY